MEERCFVVVTDPLKNITLDLLQSLQSFILVIGYSSEDAGFVIENTYFRKSLM